MLELSWGWHYDAGFSRSSCVGAGFMENRFSCRNSEEDGITMLDSMLVLSLAGRVKIACRFSDGTLYRMALRCWIHGRCICSLLYVWCRVVRTSGKVPEKVYKVHKHHDVSGQEEIETVGRHRKDSHQHRIWVLVKDIKMLVWHAYNVAFWTIKTCLNIKQSGCLMVHRLVTVTSVS